MSYAKKICDAILDLDTELCAELAEKAVAAGDNPLELINEGIRPALDVMGEKFANGECFLPEIMIAGRSADAAISIIEPELLKSDFTGESLGRFLIATVEGDIHDIGKNIVALLMKAAGFEVINLGVDQSCEKILAAAEENDVQLIGLSTLLTTTMVHITEFIELLQEKGLCGKYKVMVGGAPLSSDFAEKVGADGFSADAVQAVELAKRLLNK